VLGNDETGENEMMINRTVYESLKSNHEGCQSTDEDGSRWAMVYLPNASIKGISPLQFAGALSVLKQQGAYRPTGDKYFGEIKIN
jgi:hypothetical protein